MAGARVEFVRSELRELPEDSPEYMKQVTELLETERRILWWRIAAAIKLIGETAVIRDDVKG